GPRDTGIRRDGGTTRTVMCGSHPTRLSLPRRVHRTIQMKMDQAGRTRHRRRTHPQRNHLPTLRRTMIQTTRAELPAQMRWLCCQDIFSESYKELGSLSVEAPALTTA